MFVIPPVHLAIMQPVGYVHSLGLLDPARNLRHQLRRLGAQVSLAKNRLREDAINIVFGAHLGFPPGWRERHTCLFFNLEQLGDGGAVLDPAYLQLLRSSAVIDYDADNVAAYCSDPADVPLVPLLHAPYLHQGEGIALEERPIDLLFFGSQNPRRQALIERIEACGVSVSLFDAPIYGPERDAYVRQAKAVLNCHFYETSRFEQVRAAHCLSLGTPVVSERRERTRAPAAFEDAVSWFDEAGLADFFRHRFGRPQWFAEARAQLERFRTHDPVEAVADMLAFAIGVHQGHGQHRPSGPHRPTRINLGSGKDYKPGWLNLDVLERAEPDLVLDIGREIRVPMQCATRYGGQVRLEAGQIETIHASNVLEHVPDLPLLMSNALTLLKPGGRIEIEVPYEKAPTAWQDPTHLRAMNENSWLYYTDWFWYLGWFEHRFDMTASQWLDAALAPCAQAQAAFMRVTLTKVETTPRERTVARTMQADFGGIDDDLPRDDPAAEAAPAPLAGIELALRGLSGAAAAAGAAGAAGFTVTDRPRPAPAELTRA